jgi:hypothetical protein
MGYKSINKQTLVLKGSVTPAKVIEQKPRCERMHESMHRWFNAKFSMCPVSCFPFKLGHAKTKTSSQNGRVHAEIIRDTKRHHKTTAAAAALSNKPIYVDYSDRYMMFEFDSCSLGKQSTVIERDVNNSLKATSPNTPQIKPIDDLVVEVEEEVTVAATTMRRKKERSNSTSSVVKARFEKRLSKMRKMGEENKIVENMEMEKNGGGGVKREERKSTSEGTVTFSSIFGDSNVFASSDEISGQIDLDETGEEDLVVHSDYDEDADEEVEKNEGNLSESSSNSFDSAADYSSRSDEENGDSIMITYF